MQRVSRNTFSLAQKSELPMEPNWEMPSSSFFGPLSSSDAWQELLNRPAQRHVLSPLTKSQEQQMMEKAPPIAWPQLKFQAFFPKGPRLFQTWETCIAKPVKTPLSSLLPVAMFSKPASHIHDLPRHTQHNCCSREEHRQ